MVTNNVAGGWIVLAATANTMGCYNDLILAPTITIGIKAIMAIIFITVFAAKDCVVVVKVVVVVVKVVVVVIVVVFARVVGFPIFLLLPQG